MRGFFEDIRSATVDDVIEVLLYCGNINLSGDTIRKRKLSAKAILGCEGITALIELSEVIRDDYIELLRLFVLVKALDSRKQLPDEHLVADWVESQLPGKSAAFIEKRITLDMFRLMTPAFIGVLGLKRAEMAKLQKHFEDWTSNQEIIPFHS